MMEFLTLLWLVLSTPAAMPAPPLGAPPGPGELLITEVMVDPDAVRDSAGEYVELLNTAGHPLQLLGLVIRDDGRDWCPIDVPLAVEPGQAVVIARRWEPAANGGFFPAYLCRGNSFHLGNARDAVILDWYGIIVDEVRWDRKGWPLERGAALELDPVCGDDAVNDEPSAWRPSRTPLPSGDRGTPGRRNPAME